MLVIAAVLLTAVANYRITQNFGEVKFWRINRFRVLARNILMNLQ